MSFVSYFQVPTERHKERKKQSRETQSFSVLFPAADQNYTGRTKEFDSSLFCLGSSRLREGVL
jgi:23S rRNA C2498 (ribose-2'-O)-methylase RlmM